MVTGRYGVPLLGLAKSIYYSLLQVLHFTYVVSCIYMLFTGLRPRAVVKTKGTVFPYTDRPRQVNNIFIFFPTFVSLQINLERLSERA